MARTNEGGSILGFIVVGIVLVGLFVGGVFWIHQQTKLSETTQPQPVEPPVEQPVQPVVPQPEAPNGLGDSLPGGSAQASANTLPETGVSDAVLSALMAGILTAVALGYMQSRRSARAL
jgi:LPXTG-motif cell wall-anchored protein